MKTPFLLLSGSFCLLLLGGCAYDDDDEYHSGRVTITREVYYPNRDFDEYAPYYAYSGRRYYRTGHRYVYYADRRPYYVTVLPSGARYVTPARGRYDEVRVVRRYGDRERNSPDWPR